MKRFISIVTVLLLCLSLAYPAYAAEEFVPSISYKDHPEVVPAPGGGPGEIIDEDGEVIDELDDDCIVITPVSEAEDSDEIPDEARETLLEVYDDLTDGDMELPYDLVDENIDPEDMVIRDLIDISLICDEHSEYLEEGNYLRITFDLGVDPDTDVIVMVYSDGQWYPAIDVINNGDGTVTVILDRVGVVAFSVAVRDSVQTGDNTNLLLWTVLLIASAAALVALVILRRKALR